MIWYYKNYWMKCYAAHKCILVLAFAFWTIPDCKIPRVSLNSSSSVISSQVAATTTATSATDLLVRCHLPRRNAINTGTRQRRVAEAVWAATALLTASAEVAVVAAAVSAFNWFY